MISLSAMTKLQNIKAMVDTITLANDLLQEMSSLLEEQSVQLYSLDQDRKRLLQKTLLQEQKIQSLEKRYSDLLYHIHELKEA